MWNRNRSYGPGGGNSTSPGGGLATEPGGGLSTGPLGGLSTGPGGGLSRGEVGGLFNGPGGGLSSGPLPYMSNISPWRIFVAELERRRMKQYVPADTKAFRIVVEEEDCMSILKFLERMKLISEEWFPIPVTEKFAERMRRFRVWKPTKISSAILPHPLSWLKKKH